MNQKIYTNNYVGLLLKPLMKTAQLIGTKKFLLFGLDLLYDNSDDKIRFTNMGGATSIRKSSSSAFKLNVRCYNWKTVYFSWKTF